MKYILCDYVVTIDEHQRVLGRFIVKSPDKQMKRSRFMDWILVSFLFLTSVLMGKIYFMLK